jgi:hypothetical protein
MGCWNLPLVVVALFAAPTDPAMSTPPRCRVAGAEKLAASVGANAICSAVERAIASVAPNASYHAEIKVLSSTRLAAVLVVNGRTLQEQKFAVMDRDLNAASVQRFAQSLATEVAKASKS